MNTQTDRLEETTFRNGRLQLETEESRPFTPASSSSGTHGKLMSDGRTTTRIGREDLKFIPVPPATETFQPVAHHELVDAIDEALALRRFQITRSEFAASPDGMKLFGLLEINAFMEGISFAIGLRNSNDKSMRLGMVAGYRVQVCDNMSFAGDFNPLLAKHTRGLDLIEAVSIAVDRIHRGFEPLKRAIGMKRLLTISDDEARIIIYQAFMEKKFPVSLIKQVHRNYFEPEWEDFRERSLWSLENAFTEAFKALNPLTQYKTTARLGKFISPLVAGSLAAPADSATSTTATTEAAAVAQTGRTGSRGG